MLILGHNRDTIHANVNKSSNMIECLPRERLVQGSLPLFTIQTFHCQLKHISMVA